MFKFPEGTEPALIEKVQREARRFMKKLHWGIQGPLSTQGWCAIVLTPSARLSTRYEQIYAKGCRFEHCVELHPFCHHFYWRY